MDLTTLPVVEGANFIELPFNHDEWAAGKALERLYAQSKPQPHRFTAFRSELDVPTAREILGGDADEWAPWEAFGRTLA